ncbi:hypothetical protein XELAEV_18019602mg [Xenopus laevis]|uniref:G-protein coupled receptors family 1 profile domain-containing protein n=1 Tax=Xenopus laevis TaxID=8355 RepID=A0A974DFJ4_XENLA|nr:hypothetical protein XELAEV_18019602mg [Xenopus laevis]
MSMKNQTLVSEFVLLGFQNLHNFKIPLFSLFLLIYIMIIWENVLIIVLVSSSRNLQSPMYFFLQQLYVAICIPLRYSSIMSHRVCVTLIFVSWLLSLIAVLIIAKIMATLQFCDQNTINHFFCDFFPIVELSCSDTYLVHIDIMLQSIPVIFIPFILITVSYMCIAHAILKIVSNTGRQKAFSTCSSHLAVVSIFYGALIAIYVIPPRKESQTISKVLSLLYTVVTPLVNPLIYSLRSKDIRDVLQRILNRLHQAPRGQIY